MKKLAVLMLSLMSAGVLASESCNFELQSGVRVDKASLEFTLDGEPQYKIVENRELWMNGQRIALNANQQKQLAEYAEGVRSLVPQVQQLSMDAVDLAGGVIDTMYTQISSPDNPNRKKLLNEFANIKRDVGAKFAPGKPFYFNEKGTNPDEVMDHEFETRINQLMDSMGAEISWDILKKVGASIVSPGNIGDLEASMEQFQKRMETEMGERSKKLGQHADSFCQSVKAVDQREEALRQNVAQLSSVNFIKMKPADAHVHEHMTEEQMTDQHAMHAAQGM